ncbi:phage head-tail connector protein [Micromonospora chersina]
MALGDPYATKDELKARMDITDTADDDRITEALDSASREIEAYCRRQFNDAGAASARLFRPAGCDLAVVDDFSTTTGLVVETSTDGTTWTAWSASDYELEPLNGTVGGLDGFPFWRLVAVGSRSFPELRRSSVRVTARWGWTAVPAPVGEACELIASEGFKMGDAPFGVAGFGEFGSVRVRMNSRAQSLLGPYRRNPVLVG